MLTMTDVRKFDGDLLKKLRNAAKLSQSGLAQKLDMRVDQNHIISSWETGRVQPVKDDVQKLAGLFDRPVDSLYHTVKSKPTGKATKPKKVTAPVDQTPVKPIDKSTEELEEQVPVYTEVGIKSTAEMVESDNTESDTLDYIPVKSVNDHTISEQEQQLHQELHQEFAANIKESIQRVADKLVAVENMNMMSHLSVLEYVDTFLDGTFAVKDSNTDKFYRVSIKEL